MKCHQQPDVKKLITDTDTSGESSIQESAISDFSLFSNDQSLLSSQARNYLSVKNAVIVPNGLCMLSVLGYVFTHAINELAKLTV